MTPAFAEGEGAGLAAALPRPPLLVEPRLLAGLCDADAPRGALAVARLPRPGVEGLPRRSGGVYLYLDRLQDPGNLGAVARVAEALGAAGLALAPDTVDPNHPRALRASAGSLLRLPAAVGVAPEALDRHLTTGDGAPLTPPAAPDRAPEALPPQWVALAPHGGQPPPHGLTAATVVLALGAEGPGLTPAVADRAALHWTVPLAPPVESLNVAVAAALVLWEVARARGSTGGPASPPSRAPRR